MTKDEKMLEDLQYVNKFVGTNLIDKYLRLFCQKYKHVSLGFGLNKKEYYICDRFGARVM